MAYEKNRENVHSFSEETVTGVWLAPKGSTLPTALTTEPASPFRAVGWLSEDGISRNVEKDVQEHNALQGGAMIYKKVSKVTQTFTFTATETNAVVLGLVNADSAITVVGDGVATPKFARQKFATGQDKVVERAIVIDMADGAVKERYTVSAVDITFQGEIKLASNEDIRLYEFTATVLAGAEGEYMTNLPSLIV